MSDEGDTRERKLFIGGVSYNTPDEAFRQFFEKYGPLEDCILMRDRFTGTSRGFGFVVFQTKEAALKVLADKGSLILDGKSLDPKGSIARGDPSLASEPQPGKTKKIFIGGLNKDDTGPDSLRSYFSKFGEIEDAVVMRERADDPSQIGRSRGFGFITFANPESVEQVLATKTHFLDDRNMDIKRAVPKNKMDRNRGPPRGGRGGFRGGRGGYDRGPPGGYDRRDYGRGPPRGRPSYDGYGGGGGYSSGGYGGGGGRGSYGGSYDRRGGDGGYGGGYGGYRSPAPAYSGGYGAPSYGAPPPQSYGGSYGGAQSYGPPSGGPPPSSSYRQPQGGGYGGQPAYTPY